MLGGKEGEVQQGTELNDISNSRDRSTGHAYLPQQAALAPLPTFQRTPPGANTRTASHTGVDSQGLPEIQNVGNLLHPTGRRRYHRYGIAGSCGPNDRPEETPPLPKEWTEEHDRAMCFMASFYGYGPTEAAIGCV